jgi:hypothetical protein
MEKKLAKELTEFAEPRRLSVHLGKQAEQLKNIGDGCYFKGFAMSELNRDELLMVIGFQAKLLIARQEKLEKPVTGLRSLLKSIFS